MTTLIRRLPLLLSSQDKKRTEARDPNMMVQFGALDGRKHQIASSWACLVRLEAECFQGEAEVTSSLLPPISIATYFQRVFATMTL